MDEGKKNPNESVKLYFKTSQSKEKINLIGKSWGRVESFYPLRIGELLNYCLLLFKLILGKRTYGNLKSIVERLKVRKLRVVLMAGNSDFRM